MTATSMVDDSNTPKPFPKAAKIGAVVVFVLLALSAMDVPSLLPSELVFSVQTFLNVGFILVVAAIASYTFWEILRDWVRNFNLVFSKKDGS